MRVDRRWRGGGRGGLFGATGHAPAGQIPIGVIAAGVVGSLVALGSFVPAAGPSAAAAPRSSVTKVVETAKHPHVAAKPKVLGIYATYYGWFTNTPPGCATAYSGCAHGAGTYGDPITFASDRKEFKVGTRLYYPTLEKYFVMGDECTECTADWKGKGPDGGPRLRHVDLWIGGRGANAFAAINCEDALTQGMPSGAPLLTPFVLHPPPTLPVSSEPIFDSKNGHCFGGAKTSASYGRYQNAAAGSCLSIAGSTGSTAATRAADLEPCSTGVRENLAFEGAFFVAQHLCLETKSGRVGAAIVFAHCTGGARQQWETGPSGEIQWIQYIRCVVDSGGKPVLGSCHTGAAGTWRYVSESAPLPAPKS